MPNHRSSRVRKKAADAAEILRLCAHPYRLLLLCLLEHEAWSVSALAAETGLSQPAVSQHLARLRKACIVAPSRKSNRMYYRLNDGHSSMELKAIVAAFCDDLASDTPRRTAAARRR